MRRLSSATPLIHSSINCLQRERHSNGTLDGLHTCPPLLQEYLSLVGDAPPFDPFTDVTNRIPGYQNFGIFSAIPFTTVALQVTFQPFQGYSTKIYFR